MIDFIKTHEDEILIRFLHDGIFDKQIGNRLYDNIRSYINENSTLTLDLNGIDSIDSEGLIEIESLINSIHQKRCLLRFSHVQPELNSIINSIMESHDGYSEKILV